MTQQPGPSAQYKLSKTIDFIRSLLGGGERSFSWTDVRAFLDLMTEGHLFIGGQISDGAEFVRGRQIFTPDGFTEISQLVVRDPKDVTSYGRCNAPKQSILYASTNLETIYSELSLQFGDLVQTITIRKKAGNKVTYAIVGEVDHLRRHGKCALGGKEIEDQIRKHWASLSEIDKLRFNITDAFVADRYRTPVKNPHEYKITSAFCDLVYSMGVDALVYPSVGHLGGWNIAIKKEAFLSDFEVISSEVHEIYDSPGYGIFGTILKKRHLQISDGKIEWAPAEAPAIAFKSFDEYIRYQLCQSERQRALLIIAQKNVADKLSPEELSQLKSQFPQMETTEFSIAKLVIDGARPLNSGISLELLVAELDSNNKDWDFITLSVCEDVTDPEKIRTHLSNMKKDISTGLHSYVNFTRDGKPLLASYSASIQHPKLSL